ncbi:hypothetical protein GS941_27505 [Rhodococcus hoagii]|nr:hypothetical protein [Prescottella equi]
MRVHLTEILAGEDPVIAGFSPSGTGLLVTPYPSDPETVRILGWPSLNEIAQLDASDVGAAYGFGLAGCWIDDELVAVYATEDSLIVTDSHFARLRGSHCRSTSAKKERSRASLD